MFFVFVFFFLIGNEKALKDFEHLSDKHKLAFQEDDSCRVEGEYELEEK